MLREWKRVQVATQERAAKSQPLLTDAEAENVIRRSFGLEDVVAAVAAVVPFSPRSRSRDEALDLAVRQSFARRRTRLLAVPADRQDAVLGWMAEQDELARLASRILSEPAPVTAASYGNEAQIWQLTDTGLVVNDDGALRFALPLFEQHFGAHALTRGIAAIEEAAAPEAFPRWRYAVAFALSTSQPGQKSTCCPWRARIPLWSRGR